ncbi:MAG: hypothetical protein DRJ01_08755 [Bacteroidetes bacterium]|nr:MAG: hypothetical protein DRJ01_08755 [Bacteroidota bacterium]
MNNSDAQLNFNSSNIIIFAYKKRKPLLIITSIAIIVSIIVSYTITPRYESSVILFPTSSSSISQDLLRDNVSSKDILKFGEEEEVEQLLQVLHSDEIKNTIIKKYNLFQHYNIDTASAYPLTKLNKEFNKNFSFSPTKFMSIEIKVLDTDPKLAADMANDVASLIDTTMNNMQRERAFKALKIVEKQYFSLKNQIQILEDSLQGMRKYGVLEYEKQSEVISDGYAQAIIADNTKAANKLKQQLDILAKYGGPFVSITNYLEFEKKQLSSLKERYAEAQVDAYQNLPHKFIVNNAQIAEKKSFPVRWLIVTISTISTFILTLLLLLIVDNFKKTEIFKDI